MNVANTEQAAAWNGDDGRDWLDNEAAYNASYRRYTRRLFDFVPIAEDANVLDIGCGCGETTRLAA
jgi:cyclopropane fatty-acyl-phospholipid synthase-like methyltransferase